MSGFSKAIHIGILLYYNAGNLAPTAVISTALLLPFPTGGRFESIWPVV